jgi:hypothetical protein
MLGMNRYAVAVHSEVCTHMQQARLRKLRKISWAR